MQGLKPAMESAAVISRSQHGRCPESGASLSPSKAASGNLGMSTIWWRFFVAGAAVIIVLCLAALEIAADRADRLRWSRGSTAPVNNADEQDRPWERN